MIDEIRLENLWDIASEHIKSKAFWKAKEILYTILKIEPAYVAARYELANIYYSDGQFEQALLHACLAHRLNPEYPGLNILLANCFYLHGLYEEALKCFEKEESLEPQNDEIKSKILMCREIISLVKSEEEN